MCAVIFMHSFFALCKGRLFLDIRLVAPSVNTYILHDDFQFCDLLCKNDALMMKK